MFSELNLSVLRAMHCFPGLYWHRTFCSLKDPWCIFMIKVLYNWQRFNSYNVVLVMVGQKDSRSTNMIDPFITWYVDKDTRQMRTSVLTTVNSYYSDGSQRWGGWNPITAEWKQHSRPQIAYSAVILSSIIPNSSTLHDYLDNRNFHLLHTVKVLLNLYD